MSVELNNLVGGVGNNGAAGVQGVEIEPINPADVAPSQQNFKADAGASVAEVRVEKTSRQTEVEIINTPGTIAHQHMQNYLSTGDLASYNFAYFAARMQMQQG